MTADTEALRQAFERRMQQRGWKELHLERDGLDYTRYELNEAWHAYQAGHAAAKAETAPKPPACAADDGWQPIETAPKDTAVLLAWWSNWSEEWNMEVNFAGSTRGGWRHGSATYWRPLPKPPTDKGAPDV